MNIPYVGEGMALLTAVVWAFSVILFKKSGETVHPIALNVYKGLLAAILLVPTMAIAGETLFRPVPAGEYWLLFFSGVLGIGVADTLFFKCLNLVGASMSAVIDCMYSPFIIGLSMVWIGERLTTWQIVGVVLIISAVLSATHRRSRGPLTRPQIIFGLVYGILAMASMAVGIVMIKPLLDRSPLFWVTEIRLLGGLAALVVVLLIRGDRRKIIATALAGNGRLYTFWGSFLGTYISLILWLGGMKYTQASIAAALNQTSNIFIFVFAALMLKEKITLVRSLAILVAVAGVYLVSFN